MQLVSFKNLVKTVEESSQAVDPKKQKIRRTKIIINPSVNEDNLNELSKTLLGRYIKKAKNDIGNKSYQLGGSKKKSAEDLKKIKDRSKNVNKAVDKLTELKTDLSIAVSDPYKAIGDPENDFYVKNLALQIIKARTEP